ncbi:hypothetical protein VTJ83DRAFT_3631 [Remersonia thermophila]|uniref:DUF1993 domain-containing protein n=1 Tax=Remersonia thermophila TaxID=72144 RepID=A0ABR4DF51_9PEZI
MSAVPLYDATIVVAKQALETLRDLLVKAQAHPEAATLPQARLIDDMLPFTFQVQTVSNFAKKTVERLTGRDLDVWEDNETTLEQLAARVQKTLDLLDTVKPEDLVKGGAEETHELKFGPNLTSPATTHQYVLGYYIPNLFFHLSTAYGLLRSKGLDIGKKDYIKHFVSPFFPPRNPEQQ